MTYDDIVVRRQSLRSSNLNYVERGPLYLPLLMRCASIRSYTELIKATITFVILRELDPVFLIRTRDEDAHWPDLRQMGPDTHLWAVLFKLQESVRLPNVHGSERDENYEEIRRVLWHERYSERREVLQLTRSEWHNCTDRVRFLGQATYVGRFGASDLCRDGLDPIPIVQLPHYHDIVAEFRQTMILRGEDPPDLGSPQQSIGEICLNSTHQRPLRDLWV